MSLGIRIAERLQEGLPLAERPYALLGHEIGCGEDAVLVAVHRLLQEGTIRTFGAFVDYSRLGYEGLLCGVCVPEGRLGGMAASLGVRPEVTHNYLRDHAVNMWFTAILDGKGEMLSFVENVLYGFALPFVALATQRRLKLKPVFRFTEAEGGDDGTAPEEAEPLAPLPRPYRGEAVRVLALLQTDFPITPRPFEEIAGRLGRSSSDLIEFLENLKRQGILRRIGASLHHGRAGYAANALVAWTRGGDEGRRAARFPWASHVYLRESVASSLPFEWPYTLYTMVHAREESMLRQRVAEMEQSLGAHARVVLPTLQEFKKTRFVPSGEEPH